MTKSMLYSQALQAVKEMFFAQVPHQQRLENLETLSEEINELISAVNEDIRREEKESNDDRT